MNGVLLAGNPGGQARGVPSRARYGGGELPSRWVEGVHRLGPEAVDRFDTFVAGMQSVAELVGDHVCKMRTDRRRDRGLEEARGVGDREGGSTPKRMSKMPK
jgi:hypothetical protein